MTVPLLSVPMSPPGMSPARQAQGEGSTDVAGLFALLLAGAQPVQANIVGGAQPTTRPALAPAPAGAVTPETVPAPATRIPMPPDLGAVGPVPAATPTAGAALPLPPAPGQPGLGEGQLPAQPGPPIQEIQPPGLAAAQQAAHTPTAPAPHPALDRRIDSIGPAPENAVAPLRAAIAADQPLPRPMPDGAQMPHASSKRQLPLAPTARAQAPIAPDGWSPQGKDPRHVAGAPAARPRVPSPPTTANRAIATSAPELARPNVSPFAAISASPGPAVDPPAAHDQGRLESTFEAFETALGRAEQSAAEPMRPPAAGRTAPPAPVFQIGVQIARAVPARVDRLFVQLEPAALGRVEVRLEFHRDNQVSAMIAAERPDTLDALQRDARLLERSLHDAGLRLDSDGLTFSLKREQAQDQAHDHAAFALCADDVGDQALVTTHDDGPPPLHWFHGLRTLDIRI